jgi:hypothetical protein
MSANALGLGRPGSPRALLGDLRCRLSAMRRPNENESEPLLGRGRRELGYHFTAPRAHRDVASRVAIRFAFNLFPGCAVRTPRAKVPSSTVAIATSEIIESSTNLPAALGDGQAVGMRRYSKEFPRPRERKPARGEGFTDDRRMDNGGVMVRSGPQSENVC